MPAKRALLSALLLLPTLLHAQQIEIRLVVWDGEEGQKPVRAAVRSFEKAHPHIRVKLEAATQSYQEKLLAQYAADVAPDVAMMDPSNFQRYAKRGAFLSLNPFIKQTPGFKLDEYYKPIIDASTLEGELYVLPRDIAPCGLVYYNKRLFREAGIPYPDGTWTWDFKERPHLKHKDFIWVIKQLTKRDAKGKTTQYGYTPAWKNLIYDMFSWSCGGMYVDDRVNPRKLLHDDPKVIRAFEYVFDLSFKQKLIPNQNDLQNVAQTSARQLFVSQKAAMFQSGIWDVPNVRKENVPGTKDFFEWDICLPPAYKDGTLVTPTGGSGYSILSSTKHPQEAWMLVKWMAGPEGMYELAKSGYAQPAIRRLALQNPWIPKPSDPVEMQYPPSKVVTDHAVPFVYYDPGGEHWKEVAGYVSSKLDPMYLGSVPPALALKEAKANGQKRLDQILKEEDLKEFDWRYGLLFALAVLAAITTWIYLPERKRKLSRREKLESRAGYAFALPWIVGLFVFTLGPMILSLLMSFSNWDIIQEAKFRGGGNYAEAFKEDPRFWKSMSVTFLYTFVAVPLGLLGSLMLAMLLNQKVRGIPIFRTCFYIPTLASGVAAALIWRKLFQTDGGLINRVIYGEDGQGNFLGLATALSNLTGNSDPANWFGTEQTALPALIIMSLWGIGGGMVILLAGLQGIPQHYYEAARLDGAGAWQGFRRITLPLLTPALFFTLITGFIGSFQTFTQAFVITAGGPSDSTMFYMLHLYNNAFMNLRMGYASALAWILFFVILGFTLLQFKFSKWVHYEANA